MPADQDIVTAALDEATPSHVLADIVEDGRFLDLVASNDALPRDLVERIAALRPDLESVLAGGANAPRRMVEGMAVNDLSPFALERFLDRESIPLPARRAVFEASSHARMARGPLVGDVLARFGV